MLCHKTASDGASLAGMCERDEDIWLLDVTDVWTVKDLSCFLVLSFWVGKNWKKEKRVTIF
jgi:hypothetical protein